MNFSEHPQKQRRGLIRLRYALQYSLDGLAAGMRSSSAFRLELALAVPGVVLAFFLGRNWLESAILIMVLALVPIVEMINCGIEATIDRISYEIHPLSKQAKDFGSAAVLLSCLLCGGVWLSMLCLRFLSY